MSQPQHQPGGDRPRVDPYELIAAMADALGELEDRDDAQDAKDALDEPGDDIPAEQVWAELGLS